MPVTFPPGFKPLPFSYDRIFLFECIDQFIREHAEEFVATGRWLDTDANLERQVLRHGRVLDEGSLPRFERFQLIASRIKVDPPNYSLMTREQQREAGRRVLLVVWLMTTPHVADTTKPITRMQEWRWGDPDGMGLALAEEADEHTPATDDGFQIASLNRMFARVVLCNEDAGPTSDVAVWAEIGYAALIAANGGESLTPPLVTRTTEAGGLRAKYTILKPTPADYERAGISADHPDAARAAGRFRREGLAMLGASNALAPQFKQELPLELAAASSSITGFLSPAKIAKKNGLNVNRVRMALQRWRRQHEEGWIEASNPKPREPRILYSYEAVGPIIEKMKRSGPANI